ncbi:hypothetical protein [Pseudoteredinibacter isoporae]|uniref:Uncharacterized protein n=1 Tax=Pseudoteredinibacter isoporae TaxID=570281 RepID=A0A7X0JVM3_9GAMM|nr:hypothetical protein [Pseudoteredinibacter isoporae]MBB6523077.1 hypothetical protein [Pseudoteredinibacter isoporae]NHO88597.1 hypothetical protein [Pseudoteredinibacter isoporae]NIB22712.1 hypothetical protein [Pseudoteredinibacter isoporae]
MRHYLFTSLLTAYSILLSSFSLALSYSGSFERSGNGAAATLPVQAELERKENQLSGSILVDNYRYVLNSHLQGSSFQGYLTDQAGAQVAVQVHPLSDNTLNLHMYLQGAFAQPQTLLLRPDNNSAPSANQTPTQAQQQNHQALDYQLVGRWVYSESYTSGEYSFGSQDWVELRPNGDVYSASQSFGGGPDSNVISGAQSTPAGRWRIQQAASGDRLLSLQENGQWYLYGRYYIENGRMLITRPNGEKEFWRQHQ